MQGPTAINRQLIMRCQITNQRLETSERFIDMAEFALWRFLLEEKHRIHIADAIPCVWVPQDECRRNDKLFAHAAYHAPVARLTYEKFDERTGIKQTRIRFALHAELDRICILLEEHFGGVGTATAVDTAAGEAISTTPVKRWFKAAAAGFAA